VEQGDGPGRWLVTLRQTWAGEQFFAVLAREQFTGGLPTLDLSADGSRLAVAAQGIQGSAEEVEHQVHIWDARSGEALRVLPIEVEEVVLSPDGTMLLDSVGVWDTSTDQAPNVWDTVTGKKLATLQIEDCPHYEQFSFSPDGRRLLATAADEGLLCVWDTATGNLVGRAPSGDHYLGPSLAFSPDNTLLAIAACDLTDVSLWDLASLTKLADMPHPQTMGTDCQVHDVAFSPDGTRLATAGADGALRLWRVHADAMAETLCRRVDHDMALETWQSYVGNGPYKPTCSDLVGGSD